MDFLNKFDLKSIPIFKILGIGLLGIVFLTVAISFIGFGFRTAFNGSTGYSSDSSSSNSGMIAPSSLSVRNVATEMAQDSGVGMYDEKDFEVTEYSAVIKTGKFEKTCSDVEVLKGLDYVVFESSNKNDTSCYYTFKVKNDKADEVLGVIQGLKPESLQTNKFTLKNVIDDYTSEIEILTKKLASVEKTLTDAQSAYDQVTVLATRNQDVASLAKIIESKIQLIERLTQERLNTKERIDRLNQSKAEQIDRVDYTLFSVSVYDIVIFDLKQIKNSWVYELKQFVNEFNSMIQNITVGLGTYLFQLIQIIIYLFIALFVVFVLP